MWISFIQFESLEEAKTFWVVNAHPEREDNVLGQLPDGQLVYAKFSADDESDDFYVEADL